MEKYEKEKEFILRVELLKWTQWIPFHYCCLLYYIMFQVEEKLLWHYVTHTMCSGFNCTLLNNKTFNLKWTELYRDTNIVIDECNFVFSEKTGRMGHNWWALRIMKLICLRTINVLVLSMKTEWTWAWMLFPWN